MIKTPCPGCDAPVRIIGGVGTRGHCKKCLQWEYWVRCRYSYNDAAWERSSAAEILARKQLALQNDSIRELPVNESKVKYEDVPAALREDGKPNGKVLTALYLADSSLWCFTSKELTDAYQSGKLTYRLKVGRTFAYRFDEICRLYDERKKRR